MCKTPMPNIVRYLSASYSPFLETTWGLVRRCEPGDDAKATLAFYPSGWRGCRLQLSPRWPCSKKTEAPIQLFEVTQTEGGGL